MINNRKKFYSRGKQLNLYFYVFRLYVYHFDLISKKEYTLDNQYTLKHIYSASDILKSHVLRYMAE